MFELRDRDGEWVGLFLRARHDEELNGVWVWCGLFRDATATPVTVGMRTEYLDTTGARYRRVEATVVKVNRVTVDLKADDGTVTRIRVDR